MQKVSFVHMADGTAEDYRIIGEAMKEANKPLADDVLALLQESERIGLGYKVTRLCGTRERGTQCAKRR